MSQFRHRVLLAVGISAALAATACGADWKDLVKPLEKAVSSKGSSSGSVAGLSDQDTVSGLKEALGVGTERAIALLGRDGGFLNDSAVKIPLPGPLKTIDKGLRAVGQTKLADEFIATMNHAAEQAVPKTAKIFGDTIRGMSLQDAKGILTGPTDAATKFFREQSGSKLQDAILPIVQEATSKAGVTSSYKKMIGGAGMAGKLFDSDSVDLDKYVTGKTMDGLFLKLAEEEKRIRENPLARSTDLLKKVFGSL